jgi:mRNA-degrading endonuclease toxin of MazEF toxin-antitoxin module
MGSLAVGDVVLIPFPYADFSRFKKRPALIVGEAEFSNLILCQITSKANTARRAISLHTADFSEGTLRIDSYIRFDKLFTVEPSVIAGKAGALKTGKIKLVRSRIRGIFI